MTKSIDFDAVFAAVSGDLGRYAEDYALWQAKKVAGAAAPRPPDIEAIAKIAVRSPSKASLELFAREFAPAGTSFAQGTTGLGGGRPTPSPVDQEALVKAVTEQVCRQLGISAA